jgi:hypothetical protein
MPHCAHPTRPAAWVDESIVRLFQQSPPLLPQPSRALGSHSQRAVRAAFPITSARSREGLARGTNLDQVENLKCSLKILPYLQHSLPPASQGLDLSPEEHHLSILAYHPHLSVPVKSSVYQYLATTGDGCIFKSRGDDAHAIFVVGTNFVTTAGWNNV